MLGSRTVGDAVGLLCWREQRAPWRQALQARSVVSNQDGSPPAPSSKPIMDSMPKAHVREALP